MDIGKHVLCTLQARGIGTGRPDPEELSIPQDLYNADPSHRRCPRTPRCPGFGEPVRSSGVPSPIHGYPGQGPLVSLGFCTERLSELGTEVGGSKDVRPDPVADCPVCLRA